jgi:hypothetical protein
MDLQSNEMIYDISKKQMLKDKVNNLVMLKSNNYNMYYSKKSSITRSLDNLVLINSPDQ